MKKGICLLLICALGLLLLSGCSGDDQNKESLQPTTPAPSDVTASGADANGIDVDLTVLSSTMVYSEVYDMLTTPDYYRGKTVKMEGQFAVYRDETTGKYYFAVIISDATACCQQGLEFVLDGEPVYPEGYPEEGSNITVTGIFETYDENAISYCHLTAATISE